MLCIILVFNLLVMYTGLPSLVAFPPDCKTADCVIRWVFAVHWWSFQILRFLIYGKYYVVCWLHFKSSCFCWILWNNDIIIILFLRFDGELSVDAVTDWFSTTILGLPRILYYSRDTLVIFEISLMQCVVSHNIISPLYPFFFMDVH